MHQHPPKIPLCFSTRRAKAGQVAGESVLEVRESLGKRDPHHIRATSRYPSGVIALWHVAPVEGRLGTTPLEGPGEGGGLWKR